MLCANKCVHFKTTWYFPWYMTLTFSCEPWLRHLKLNKHCYLFCFVKTVNEDESETAVSPLIVRRLELFVTRSAVNRHIAKRLQEYFIQFIYLTTANKKLIKWRDSERKFSVTTSYTYFKIQQDAQLSQRDRAAGCVIVFNEPKMISRNTCVKTVRDKLVRHSLA